MWPEAPPATLGELAGRAGDPLLTEAVADLERALYGPGGTRPAGAPDCDALFRRLRRLRRGGPQPVPRGLPPLNP